MPVGAWSQSSSSFVRCNLMCHTVVRGPEPVSVTVTGRLMSPNRGFGTSYQLHFGLDQLRKLKTHLFVKDWGCGAYKWLLILGAGHKYSYLLTYLLISKLLNPLWAHKTAEQRTIVHQYGDWYTGRWWVGCYIWYSEEGTGPAQSPPRCTKCNSQPINGQGPVYQFHVIRCAIIIAFAL